jgi:hypothetical protein
VPLRGFTRGAIEKQSEMASLAKAFSLAIRGLALRALHDLMVTLGRGEHAPLQLRVLREAPVQMDGLDFADVKTKRVAKLICNSRRAIFKRDIRSYLTEIAAIPAF